jgi:hypothetical protein
MIENSMKKIEELLHNEMNYKKTIHELKLTRENKSSSEMDSEGLSKLLKKKEKELSEKTKGFEL